MKKYKDFIPKADLELKNYAFVYKDGFRRMASVAIPHLTEEEIEEHEAEVQHMINIIEQLQTKKYEMASLVAEKNMIVGQTVTSIRRMAMYAKKGKAGSSEIVALAGLKCNAIHLDLSELKPNLSTKGYPDYVEIFFNKHHTLPIALYSRSPGKEWEFLNYVTTSPYIDKRPLAIPGQPERREYQAHYTNYRNSISPNSSIVHVVLSGG